MAEDESARDPSRWAARNPAKTALRDRMWERPVADMAAKRSGEVSVFRQSLEGRERRP